MAALGLQILADLYECDPEALDDEDLIRESMIEAARRCGATIVAHNFHQFIPYGVSGVVVIAESHLAIHTWPEYGYAAIDLFTCGQTLQPELGLAYLAEALRSRRQMTNIVDRGHRPDQPEKA